MSLNTTIKTNPAESYIPSSFLTKLNSDNPSITYVDIIELANSSPEVYAIIKNDLLTYDEQFSRLIETLKNERESIILATKNKLSALKETHDSKIISDKSYLNQGVYISDILSRYKNIFGDYVSLFEFLKWGSIFIGIYMLFAVKWSVGLVTGITGYFIFNGLVLIYKSRINLCSSKTGYSAEDIFTLKNISGGLRDKIEKEANSLKLKLDNLIANFSKEYKYVADQENLILSQKLLDFDESKNSTIQVNQNNIIKAIFNINRDLTLLEENLNQLPETFDNTNLEWNKIKYTNNKDNVANLLRVGYNLVTITINNHSHTFKIPFTIPFLNQTNLSFNCESEDNTKWAIKLSYNIISRVLLSLPASKTKLTFIDPLELGGNAAPFTPLLREIYGGMVFTQPNDIDNQLSILTRAIENVIQRYLQDKFKDIGEYNLRTKEVPEPYRLLIVYNFPHGFNDTTTHKLLNILKSGPRAGVHTILVNDRNAKLPYGFS